MQFKLLKLLTAFFGACLIVACAPEAGDPLLRTETDRNPVIYGADDRIEYYQGTPAQQGAANAVFVVVDDSELVCDGGVCTLSTVPYTNLFEEGLCDDEPFREQPTIGYCTAFLVAPDRIATAGHCLTAGECGHTSFVPRFRIESAGGSAPTTIPESEVLRCGGQILRRLKGTNDYAVFGLTAPAEGITPLCIRRSGKVTLGTELVIIGHPYTIPQKIAGGAQVQKVVKNFFETNMDDYGGNSGSPVFDAATMEVQGILVRGNTDFVFDYGQNCWRSNVCPDSGCPGFEEASHTAKIAGAVPEGPCYVPAQCQDDASCDDGNLCNGDEICSGGQCQAGSPLDCPAPDACTTAACDPIQGCIAGPPVECDDADPCNGVESCDLAAGCVPGTPVVCPDNGDPCDDEVCDSGTGGCISVDNGTCGQPEVLSVTRAKYMKAKSKLEVHAKSSEQPGVSLTFSYTASGSPFSFGMNWAAGKQRYELKVQGVPRPDGDMITVTSTGGGSTVASVTVK